jgi:mRNA-degrading endonuclease YafQ of YafQ-DinJ toxin-antitoxin module
VKRALIRSNAFVRAARQLLRKNPHLTADIQAALALLSEDAFHPRLKTHKLKGHMEGSWACSGGYDLRIIFEFVDFEGSEAILLQTLGTHDEVY